MSISINKLSERKILKVLFYYSYLRDNRLWIKYISIFAQVNIKKSYTLIGQIWRNKRLYSPTGEYNKTENDKEISENKFSIKKHKSLCKNTKTIIRLRLGDYWGNIHLDFVSANIPR
jgi:hypothetical protein